MIRLENVSRVYGSGEAGVAALKDVSLEIEAGDFVAIMGHSGSGKSTLLGILGFLDRPDRGRYYFNGRDVGALGDDELASVRGAVAGFIFQQFHLLPRVSALDNAMLPRLYAGAGRDEAPARLRLEQVGLARRMEHAPNELSGGEQQRVAIARALVNDPAVLFADEPTGNLDSASERGILDLLRALNAEGRTIIMVTHEEELARSARRVLRMRDGRILSDERLAPPVSVPASRAVPEEKKRESSRARWGDYLREALACIRAHKVRSFLSILGIWIGVAAVLAMLALGQGARDDITQRLSSLGSNLIVVRPGSSKVHGVAQEAGSMTGFSVHDLVSVSRLADCVRRVCPSVRGKGQIVYGNRNWSTQLEGVGSDYPEMFSLGDLEGRFFTAEEDRRRERVALLGRTVARELFGSVSPLGSTIKINRVAFLVVGLLPEKGANSFRDEDDRVLVPVNTAMRRLLGKDTYETLHVEALSTELIPDAIEAVTRTIAVNHRLPPDGGDSFQVRDMTEIKQTIEGTVRTMNWLLGSISAISLLVGGVGIMNIMLVAVAERTREIGLRKAVGARGPDILLQFLVEAAALTGLGGVVGVLSGVGAAQLMSVLAQWSVRISAFHVLLALSFSVGVGIVFGLWPARQASRLSPLAALRYE